MTTDEPLVHAPLNEVHVYVHCLNEVTKPSDLGMTEFRLLVKKLKPKEVKETTKGHAEPGLT